MLKNLSTRRQSVTLPYMATISSGSEALGRTDRSVSRKCTYVIISWLSNVLGVPHMSRLNTGQNVEQQRLHNMIFSWQLLLMRLFTVYAYRTITPSPSYNLYVQGRHLTFMSHW